jgi:succinoglycan biosynthesis protein ExoL
MKIVYFVHDLADDAVHRRVRMLQSFADVTLLGFRRSERPVTDIAGVTPVDLGRTRDARLAHRATAVLGAVGGIRRWEECLRGATVLVARQLEMLALAALARRRVAPNAPPVF